VLQGWQYYLLRHKGSTGEHKHIKTRKIIQKYTSGKDTANCEEWRM